MGADGGGSRTTLTAINKAGQTLGVETCGGINFYADGMPRARAVLKEAADRLVQKTGAREAFLAIGSSALDGYAEPELLKAFCGDAFDPQKTFMCGDVVAGLYGLTFGDPGVIIVSGTGMMGAALDSDKNFIFSGGLGYLLNDEGGCYGIGREGVLAAVRALEKVGPATVLSDRFSDFYGFSDYRAFIPRLYETENVNAYVASFAKEVLRAAREGDAAAESIVARAISTLASHADRLLNEISFETSVLGVYGGLFEKNPDILARFQEAVAKKRPAIKVKFPCAPPEIGAVLCALERLRPPGWERTASLVKNRFDR